MRVQPRTRVGRVLFAPLSARDDFEVGAILRNETVGGALMLAATAVALLWANLGPHSYHLASGWRAGPLTLHEWVADGLLTVFFLAAGIELKRELTEGSLSRPAEAVVPIIAAVGGMALPAGIYLLVNRIGGGDPSGWAVPMATDIAFALAVLAIVGSQLPAALRAFLLTLAIVDDLGAILVIAVFYSSGLRFGWLAASLVAAGSVFALQRSRLPDRLSDALCIALGLASWWCMLQSGVHATIAGVLVGLSLRNDPDSDTDPLSRWQHHIEPWSAGLVVPMFALFSAGVPVDAAALRRVFTQAVPLGVLIGLFLGKFAGISLSALGVARFTRAELAESIRWKDILAVAQIGGIGFTVSLLMCDLAFPRDAQLAATAKASVLVASVLAALVGGAWLWHRGRRHAQLRSAAH